MAMPPPGMDRKKPDAVIAVGVGMPKKPNGRMPPPGMEPEGGDEGGGEKHSPEEAIVIRADKHCKDCMNWEPQTGECHEVDGVWHPEDACARYFKASGESHDEPDPDDAGGPSDSDEDDMA